MTRDEYKKRYAPLNEEDMKAIIKYLQDDLANVQERKLTESWKKLKQAFEDYLRLGGTVSFSLYNEQIHDYESYTLDGSEIRITNEGEILLDN